MGITVSSALWGTLVGAFFAGILCDRFGSRTMLRYIAILYLVSALGCALAWDWYMLLFFRGVVGLAIGASSVVAPVYIAEIAPTQWRGMMVGLFQFNIVAGILLAYLSNAVVASFNPGAHEWHIKLGVAVLPALLLWLLVFAIPESPPWLAAKGRVADALATLKAIGIDRPQQEVDQYPRTQASSAAARLSWSQHKRPIMIAVATAAFNQLSGINAILYYLNDIFVAAGYDKVSSGYQAVTIGACNLVFTMLALTVIDRIGRKALLLIGSLGLTGTLAVVAAIFMLHAHERWLLWMLMTFIAFFAFSQGSVIWVYISEIFPTDVRARGQSVGSATHWLLDAIIALFFPIVAAASQSLPFVIFAIAMAVQFVVVLSFFPETKQRSLEAIAAKL